MRTYRVSRICVCAMMCSSPADGEVMPVVITSYEVVMRDRRFLERHNWKLLVVDEVRGGVGGKGMEPSGVR